jgi:hypothetical protein
VKRSPLRRRTPLRAKRGLSQKTALGRKTPLLSKAPLKTKSPLRAKSRLRAKTPLQASRGSSLEVGSSGRARRRLSPRSAKARFWIGWQQQERAAAVKRATRIVNRKLGTYCEVPGCEEEGTDWHHTLGRRSPGEPWASYRHLCTLLCYGHHEPVTNPTSAADKQLRLDLKVAAAQRLHQALSLSLPGQLSFFTPEQWLDWLKTFLVSQKAQNLGPPEYQAWLAKTVPELPHGQTLKG